MDLGAGRRGVDMGPSAIRTAGLHQAIARLGYEVLDEGNIDVAEPETLPISNENARYLPEISSACEELAKKCEKALDKGSRPVVLGGDHSIAAGSVAGVAAYFHKKNKKIGLVWLDAHTDINTPDTSPSGNIHGMPLAALLGYGSKKLTHISGFAPKVSPEHVVIIGARAVDKGEADLIKKLGIRVYTMSELDERGMGVVIKEAIEIATKGTAGIHVTMDADFLDPSDAPGVGTPERGGATYRESHLAMEKLAESGQVVSVEFTEVNPLFDVSNQTGQLAVEMIASALGKRIL